MKPNLKALNGFARIIMTGSLSEAAQSLNASESALSRQIQILESSLGMELFDRTKRRLTPTPEGEAFYEEAERILASIEDIPTIVERIKGAARAKIRLIVLPRMAPRLAVPAVAEMIERHPEVSLSVEVQRRMFLERWVAAKRFDLGIGALPAHHPDVVSEQLCRVPPVVLLPKGHRLASEKTLTITQLAGERLVLTNKTTLLRRQTDWLFEEAGVPLKSPIEVSQSAMVCAMVARGIGVAIHDPLIPEAMVPSLHVVPIKTDMRLRLGLFYLREEKRSAELREMREILLEQAHALQLHFDRAFSG